MVYVLKCPVFGCDVAPSKQELLVAPSSAKESEAQFVVCHCPESHRFVASIKRATLKVAGSAT
jgi:hypothetical protein